MNKLLVTVLLLSGCDGRLATPPVDKTSEATTASDNPPIGGYESTDSSAVVHGWALDPDSPATSINVQVYLDGDAPGGTALPVTLASVPRADVNQSTGYAGNHGFNVTLPNSTHDGHPHFLIVYAFDAQTGLSVRLPSTFVVGTICAGGQIFNPTTGTCVCPTGTTFCSATQTCSTCCSTCDYVNCGSSDGCGGACGCRNGLVCSQYSLTCTRPCPTGTHDCGDGTCYRICP